MFVKSSRTSSWSSSNWETWIPGWCSVCGCWLPRCVARFKDYCSLLLCSALGSAQPPSCPNTNHRRLWWCLWRQLGISRTLFRHWNNNGGTKDPYWMHTCLLISYIPLGGAVIWKHQKHYVQLWLLMWAFLLSDCCWWHDFSKSSTQSDSEINLYAVLFVMWFTVEAHCICSALLYTSNMASHFNCIHYM